MGSNAATWAGNGTPPDLSRGDVETMAAPRPGFDPSLNPGSPVIESTNTVEMATREAAQRKAAKSLIQKDAKDAKAAPAETPAEKEPTAK